MLRLRHLTRTLGGRRIPDALDLDVAPGELLALLGHSGAGKSALLRCIAGTDTPETGEIILDGQPLRGVAPHLRPIAHAPQGAALWPQMTVRANIAFGPEFRGAPAAEVRERTEAALAAFDALALAERRPATLSGGELRRAALARAFASGGRLLLLDEPLAPAAPDERDALLATIRALLSAAGASAILATRDPELAALADRTAVIRDGRIVQTDTFDTVWRRPESAATARLSGAANLVAARVVRCGAGEFFAESPLGELHGALADPEREPEPGATVTVLMRPEHLRVSDMPPEENAFAGAFAGAGRPAGRRFAAFRTEAGPTLTMSPPADPAADPDAPLFAWILPEDLVALA